MASEVLCYNKGCGKNFCLDKNEENSCQHHPGGPIFHDAMKGWSCCKKKSTDFTEFLNIPGCTKGYHSNEKPKPKEKAPDDNPQLKNDVIVVEGPKYPAPKPVTDFVECKDPLNPLKVTVGDSLKKALDKQMQQLKLETTESDQCKGDTVVEIGTSCKNSACKGTYQGEDSNREVCTYHPGFPVFHEGMKYWSCCQKKTSDFDNFLDQVGCETGDHLWVKPETSAVKKSCRFDWHQTNKQVVISVFSKVPFPDESYAKANRLQCSIHIVFEGGKSIFERTINLWSEVNTEQSHVKMLGTKVEIILQKCEAFSWPSLEVKQKDNDVEQKE